MSDEPSREGAPASGTLSWKESAVAHLLNFGYWMAPAASLRASLASRSKKVLFWAAANVVGCSLLVALALQGILDKPEVLDQYFKAWNWRVYSVTLLDWGVFTLLFLWAVIAGVAWLLPFLLELAVNRFVRSREIRNSARELFVASSYGVLSILFYTPLVYAAGMVTHLGQPQMVWLLGKDWENPLYYAFAAILVFACVGHALYLKKALGFTWRQASTVSAGVLLVSAVVVFQFVNF
ncbi:MAG: hypothetical protein ACTSU5_05750 [Promethearchaeota archaeon]